MADAYYNKQGQLVLDLTDVPADIARIIERAVVEAPDEATFWWRVADDLAKLVNKFRDENAFLWALLEECRGNSFERR